METPELKPCPFCGSDENLEVQDGPYPFILCKPCGAYGPSGEDVADAYRRWNRRAEVKAEKGAEGR